MRHSRFSRYTCVCITVPSFVVVLLRLSGESSLLRGLGHEIGERISFVQQIVGNSTANGSSSLAGSAHLVESITVHSAQDDDAALHVSLPSRLPSSGPRPLSREHTGLTWMLISPIAACQKNKESIHPRASLTSDNLEMCKIVCEASRDCRAIDFYAKTRTCKTFSKACQNPLEKRNSPSSYRLLDSLHSPGINPQIAAARSASVPPCSRKGLFYPPPDVSSYSITASAGDCQHRCNQSRLCEAFSWFLHNGSCHLRQLANTPIYANASIISGPPSCNVCLEERNTAYPGPDVDERIVVDSWQRCQERCAKIEGCEVFSYFEATGRNCHVRAHKQRPSHAVRVTSGPPSCDKRFKISMHQDWENEELKEETTVEEHDFKSSPGILKRLNYSLSVVPTRKFPTSIRFDRCAIVGGSANLLGKKRGEAIDAHDTIIRVNKLPTKKFFTDFGAKTHIYFTNPYFLRGWRCTNYPVQYMGRNSDLCELGHRGKCKGDFQAIVWKGADEPFRNKGKNSWSKQFEKNCSVQCKSVPCAIQTDHLNRAAFKLLNIRGKEPTTGFHAFLTFSTICNSLRLFGFGGGWKTFDNHVMLKTHTYEEEWNFWEKIRTGTLKVDKRAPRSLKSALKRLISSGNLTIIK